YCPPELASGVLMVVEAPMIPHPRAPAPDGQVCLYRSASATWCRAKHQSSETRSCPSEEFDRAAGVRCHGLTGCRGVRGTLPFHDIGLAQVVQAHDACQNLL